MIAYSETRRQIVHITMAGFALLLRYLTWPQAAGLALVALGFNMFALGAIAPGILRATDRRGVRAGVLYYPLAILILVVLFPRRLDIVAAAWGVMAFGDGFATLAGTKAGRRPLPWNPRKTWAGLVAFIAAGSVGAVALSLWVAPSVDSEPSLAFSIAAPVAASLVAALVETIPIELDDNISVPAAAALVLWFAAQLDSPPDVRAALAGVIVSAPVAALAWWTRAVTRGGALAGLACAVAIYTGTFLAGTAVLGTALLLTVISSRLGRARKLALGSAEDREAKRGAGNILANCSVGALGAGLAASSLDWYDAGPLMMVAAVASGASDTVASEIGKAYGGQPRSFPTFRPVPPGTPGAISVAGTVAGVVAAALIAWPAVALWLIPAGLIPAVVVACTAGAFLESALATRFEPSNVLDNNTLNFLNTAAAAGLAVWCQSPEPFPWWYVAA